MVSIDGLITETMNEASKQIDIMNALEIVTLINQEDKKVAVAIEKELPQVAAAIDAIAKRVVKGGRLIYCGAGSSGRIGVMDAAELMPTYSVTPDRAFGLLAGGREAMYEAVEGAEDSAEMAAEDMAQIHLTPEDCIVGMAASGRTPYTIAALECGKQVGALTVSVTCNEASVMAAAADISIAPVVGPEVISGSTRMKAGTAQKMIANMLSTGVMIRLGKVYQNYMVHVQATNEKLMARATKMIADITGTNPEQAQAVLMMADRDVAAAIVMIESDRDKEQAQAALNKTGGRVREAIVAANMMQGV